jgi:hypothetical protein
MKHILIVLFDLYPVLSIRKKIKRGKNISQIMRMGVKYLSA